MCKMQLRLRRVRWTHCRSRSGCKGSIAPACKMRLRTRCGRHKLSRTLANARWPCPVQLFALTIPAAQGFATVESMRQLAVDGSGLTDENLQELADVARELMDKGAANLKESTRKVEFDRPEVRARVLRVLEKNTLQRWLSNILKDSSPERQRETELSLQRGGFMSVADVLESSLTDADLRALGLKQMHTRIKLRKGTDKLVAFGARRGIFMLEPDISPVERAKRAVAIEQLLDTHGKVPDDTQLDALAYVVSPPDTSVLRVVADISTASAAALPSAAGDDLVPTDQQSPTAKPSESSAVPGLQPAAGASTQPHVIPEPTGRPDQVDSGASSSTSSLREDSAFSEAKKRLEDQLRDLVLVEFSSRIQLNKPPQQPTHKGWTARKLNEAYMKRFGAQEGWWQSCGWRSAWEALRGFPDILTAPYANSDVFDHNDILMPSEHICAERMPKKPSKSRSKSPRGSDRVTQHAEDKRSGSKRNRSGSRRSRSTSKRRRGLPRSPEHRRSRTRSRSPLSSRRSRKRSRSRSRSLERGRRGTAMTTANDDGLVAIGVRGYLKFFNDQKGFGFIMTRDHGEIFVHASEKERASHLKVWKVWDRMPDAYLQSKQRESSLEYLLEFDLRSPKVPGKLPVAVNLRAARDGGGRGGAKTSLGPFDSEDSQVRAYRKQLVEHVVTRHGVERLRAAELLKSVPGELLKRVVEQFDNQIKSRPGSQSPTALLREICRKAQGGGGRASPLPAARRASL